MSNVGMYLRLKNNGAVFKYNNGVNVFIRKNGDRYEIKKRRDKNEKNELENGLKAEVKISDEVLDKFDKENYIFNQIHCAISQSIRHSRQNKK